MRPFDEALLDTRTPAEFAVGPDGRTIAFALHATVDDVGRHFPSELWLGGLDREPCRLTDGRSPAWSPDGARLAFLSDRITPGHNLPYTMAVDATTGSSRQPRLAATLHGSAESVAWSADGRRLLVLAADPGSYALDWSARAVTGADGVPPGVRRPRDAWRRLLLVDLTAGEATEVGPASAASGSSPGTATTNSSRSSRRTRRETAGTGRPARPSTSTPAPHARSTPGKRSLEGIVLAPDGRHLAVVEGYTSDPGLLIGSVTIIDLETGVASDPWPGLETVGGVTWADADRLWYARYDGTGTAIGELWLDGRREERWAGDAFIGAEITKPTLVLAGDGTVFSTHQAHAQPPELAPFDPRTGRLAPAHGLQRWRHRRPHFPDVRQVRWPAPDDGLEIEGRLYTPHGATGPLPLVVAVHGGPTWNWNAYFSDSEPNAVLLADAGYAVLQPNPRGGSGRGHAFAEQLLGDPGGIDLRDILAGVDWCVAEGIADPARIGIAGLSYGGYMAGWAVTQSDRFAASVAISVVADFRSFFLTSEEAAWAVSIVPGDWNDVGGPYDQYSPITHAHRATTPTLVIAGELDRCTPVSQGELLFGALAAAGCETELVVFPGRATSRSRAATPSRRSAARRPGSTGS